MGGWIEWVGGWVGGCRRMGMCAWMDAVGIDGMRLDQWVGGWIGDWGWLVWMGGTR